MTREGKDSFIEMLAKISVTETKGSLLSAIGKLLRVLDISENSIMIPTLLNDRCDFDAYEILVLAKILKASILGHNDLVEFYMSEASSQFNHTSLAHHHQQLSLCSSSQSSSTSNNKNSINHHHQAGGRQHINHPSHQQIAAPSLRFSISDSSSSSQPSTPVPTQNTESLDSSNGASMTSGNHHIAWPATDPNATVRLLLHIEELKIFIPQVTSIFESIIELYKNSVDTITYKTDE